MNGWNKLPIEAMVWGIGLLILGILPLGEGQQHYTLCIFHNLGIEFCPGCGLGRSISSLLHGDIGKSLDQHWFGIPAFLILFYRIFTETYTYYQTNLKNNGEHS